MTSLPVSLVYSSATLTRLSCSGPLQTATTTVQTPANLAAYFADYIQRVTEDDLGGEKLFRTGYRFYTTLDPVQQAAALEAVNFVISFAVITVLFAMTFKLLPAVTIAWRDVWPGSIAAALLIALGGLVIGLYFKLGGVHSAFEAAGAFAVLMVAIYYFAQIFLFCAILTRVYAHRYGSMRGST